MGVRTDFEWEVVLARMGFHELVAGLLDDIHVLDKVHGLLLLF